MYLYHISKENRLVEIENNKFRAPYYLPEGYNRIHRDLVRRHNELLDGRALYRICFYCDFETAQKSLVMDFSHATSYILRFKKQAIHDLNLNWQWDEGFNEGEALLFWVEEESKKNPWSDLCVFFNDIEIFINKEWINLENFFPRLLSKVH